MPERIKRIEFGYSARKDAPDMLKIETPFGTVSLWRGLTATNGRERMRIDVEPNGERFAGEVPVYLVRGDTSRFGCCAFMERRNPRPHKARRVETVKVAPANLRTVNIENGSRVRIIPSPSGPIVESLAPTATVLSAYMVGERWHIRIRHD